MDLSDAGEGFVCTYKVSRLVVWGRGILGWSCWMIRTVGVDEQVF